MKWRAWSRREYTLDHARSFLGDTFTLVQTTYSTRAQRERRSIVWSSEPFGEGLLILIGRFRSHVRARLREGKIKLDQISPVGFGAWRVAKGPAWEVDLKSAYARAAHVIGACDDEWLSRLLAVTRKSRLRIVGSLGTRRIVAEVVDGSVRSRREEEDKELASVYRAIRAEVDARMREVVEGKGWYWADAAFLGSLRVAREAARRLVESGMPPHPPERVEIVSVRGGTIALGDGRRFAPGRGPAIQA